MANRWRSKALLFAVVLAWLPGLMPDSPQVVLAQSPTPPTCGPMDVAFVIDTTGSMGGAITSVKTELAGILTDIENASKVEGFPDYRLALVTFKDDIPVQGARGFRAVDKLYQKLLHIESGALSQLISLGPKARFVTGVDPMPRLTWRNS